MAIDLRKVCTKISSGIKDRILSAEKSDSKRAFCFFNLPPGVRNEIYHCLFEVDDRQSSLGIPLVKRRRGKTERLRSLVASDKHSWSTRTLLLVSRQMNDETAGYVWRDATATLFELEAAWRKSRTGILKAIEGGRVPLSIASLKATMLQRLASIRRLELNGIDTLYLITRMPGEQIGQRLVEDLLDWWMEVQLTAAAASLAEARALMPRLEFITVSDTSFDSIPVATPQWMPFLLPAGPLGVGRLKEAFPELQRLRLEGSHRGQTYCVNEADEWYEQHILVRIEEVDDAVALEDARRRWRERMSLCPALWSEY